MPLLKKTDPDTAILLAIEYLAQRLTSRHAIYFRGDGQAQLVVNGNIPPVMQFTTDRLKDSLAIILDSSRRDMESDEKNGSPPDITSWEALETLEKIVDG